MFGERKVKTIILNATGENIIIRNRAKTSIDCESDKCEIVLDASGAWVHYEHAGKKELQFVPMHAFYNVKFEAIDSSKEVKKTSK